MSPSRLNRIVLPVLIAAASISLPACHSTSASAPEWQQKNEELISQHHLTEKNISGLPAAPIASNLEAASVKSLANKDSTLLYPGVQAQLFWGSGTMISMLRLAPHATIPAEKLPADRMMFVLEGSVEQAGNGIKATMLAKKREAPDGTHGGTPRTDFIYLEQGAQSTVTAGAAGARLLEVYSPFRLDYLQKAGIKNIPPKMADVEHASTPNVSPNKVYDLYDLQLTELVPGTYARLVTGRNMQVSFALIEPDSVFAQHIHPEEQLMLVLRGTCKETLLDSEHAMKPDDVVRIPANMVHGTKTGDLGCDVLNVFWPARADYTGKQKASEAAFHSIIPENARPELVVDGQQQKPALTFTEGAKWMNGRLYFSSMYFDKDFNASPQKSSTVELDPAGGYRYITAGKMQTNGLYPYRNGHLLVCDMMGHRVVEMTTQGEVVKTIADRYEGKPIDGPNDVIADAQGGVYFTDPQFTMEPKKNQPGRAVYYVSPQGNITRLLPPNDFAMPNGLLLTPDGKTLYIGNCYDDESWYPVKSNKDNFIWAYDVHPDGTISNGRKFAKLFLTEQVLDRKGRSSSADGMAIDKKGNIYVASYYGVQIFNARGAFVGMINLPSFPVSLGFGDQDMKTLYIVSFSKVYKIRTNMEGFVQKL